MKEAHPGHRPGRDDGQGPYARLYERTIPCADRRNWAYTWFWSRSRQELWNKGATSGNLQKVKSIVYDCDGDTLLVRVVQKRGCLP